MKNGHVTTAACLLAALICGCTGIDSPSQEVLYSSGRKTAGNLPLGQSSVVVVRNEFGPVIVSGSSTANSVGWLIDGSTTASTKQAADIALNGIVISPLPQGDTIVIRVGYSPGIPGPALTALLSLQIPYASPCIIDVVGGDVDVADLDSTLTIRNAYAVNVLRQGGSCQVSTTTGDVRIEAAIPAGGYCRAYVGRGNCLVIIPAGTSAGVYEKVTTGLLSQSGLVFGSSTQQGGVFTGLLGSADGEIHIEVGVGNITLQGE